MTCSSFEPIFETPLKFQIYHIFWKIKKNKKVQTIVHNVSIAHENEQIKALKIRKRYANEEYWTISMVGFPGFPGNMDF